MLDDFLTIRQTQVVQDRLGQDGQIQSNTLPTQETATIEYFNKEDEETALKELDNQIFQGQSIKMELVSQPPYPFKKHDISKQYSSYRANRHYRKWSNHLLSHSPSIIPNAPLTAIYATSYAEDDMKIWCWRWCEDWLIIEMMDHSFFLALMQTSLMRSGSIKLLSAIFSTPEELLENCTREGLE